MTFGWALGAGARCFSISAFLGSIRKNCQASRIAIDRTIARKVLFSI
jgi:hypothetical protein